MYGWFVKPNVVSWAVRAVLQLSYWLMASDLKLNWIRFWMQIRTESTMCVVFTSSLQNLEQFSCCVQMEDR
jgi:hypothetical protein